MKTNDHDIYICLFEPAAWMYIEQMVDCHDVF